LARFEFLPGFKLLERRGADVDQRISTGTVQVAAGFGALLEI